MVTTSKSLGSAAATPALVELAKASPQLLLAIAVVASLVMFHSDIGRLIDRATKLAIGPVSIEAVGTKMQNLPHILPLNEFMTPKQVDQLTKRFENLLGNSESIGTVNILWVDNNPINNLAIVDIFEAMGFHVYVARSYPEGMARFDERPFNVVISNYNGSLPTGPLVANYVGQRCERRTIIFSAGWVPTMNTPAHAFTETNNYFDLMYAVADLVEKPLDDKCLTTPRQSTEPGSQLPPY